MNRLIERALVRDHVGKSPLQPLEIRLLEFLKEASKL